MCEGKLIRNFNFSCFVWHHGLFRTAGFAKYEQQRFSSSLRIDEKVTGVLTDSRSPTRRTGLAHDTAKSFETQNYLYSRVETLFAAGSLQGYEKSTGPKLPLLAGIYMV
jgi:hypothetical protein